MEYDKYLADAKNQAPHAKIDTIKYIADLMRKKGLTMEEFNKKQGPKKEELIVSAKESKTQSKIPEIGDFICKYQKYSNGEDWYKIISETKQKWRVKKLKKQNIGTLYFDYPYCQNFTTYYEYKKDE